ncbi:oxidoreductase [Mucilaginibacter sp. SJ]|uniref:oxidoreductase n=1 Tax=Mucilaginibacter sp. SJ TaxID=3029053 RepID=UPI0023AA0B9C|nr:oxidoreductase [Mucilaginibacter sp. SJ]WEA00555.1 oxidoreductase [Mucilaginibacter sp. SJ]
MAEIFDGFGKDITIQFGFSLREIGKQFSRYIKYDIAHVIRIILIGCSQLFLLVEQYIQRLGGIPVQADVTSDGDVQKLVDLIIQKEGKIDVLWNNAGYALYGAVEDVPLEEARRQFEVNLFGLANVTQKVLPHMRKAKSGTIINTSSVTGRVYLPIGAWYFASKHVVEGWSDCLRLELKEFNINVVLLEPGAIATEFGDVALEPLTKYSGKGAYSRLANVMVNGMKAAYQKPGGAAPTSIISDAILKIVESDKPKFRYLVGKDAKMMVRLRKFLGDKLFDKVIMSQLK